MTQKHAGSGQQAAVRCCEKCGARELDLSLCRECRRELRDTLVELPTLVDWLLDAVVKRTSLAVVPMEFRRPSTEAEEESPMPFSESASKALRELDDSLRSWIVAFRALGVSGAVRRADDGRRASSGEMIGWLTEHHRDIVCTQQAAGFARAVESHRQRVLTIVNPQRLVYAGPCPTVTGKDEKGRVVHCFEGLWAHAADDVGAERFVTCWKCRETYDVEDLRTKIFARADNFLMTLDELLHTLDLLGEHLPRTRFFAWRREGLVSVRGYRREDGRISASRVRRGDPAVFELSEVRGLMAAAS